MGIRLVHQPSAGAVGAAAYATGQGRARERKQKYLLDMLERSRGNGYRRAMGGQRVAQQPQGRWQDPLELAQDDKGKSEILSQRRANASARRTGMAKIPFPEAEMQFQRAPTKEEQQHQWGLEKEKRARGFALEDREFKARQHTKQNELDFLQERDKATAEEISRIEKLRGDAFRDTPGDNVTKRWTDMKHALEMLDKSEGFDALEKHKMASVIRQKFLGGFSEEQHIVPRDKRPGNVYTDDYGMRWRRSADSKDPDTYLGFAADATPEQLAARKAQREQTFDVRGGVEGQWSVDRHGNQTWTPIKKEKDSGVSPEKRIGMIVNMAKAMTPQGESLGGNIGKAEKEVDRLLGLGGIGGDSGQATPPSGMSEADIMQQRQAGEMGAGVSVAPAGGQAGPDVYDMKTEMIGQADAAQPAPVAPDAPVEKGIDPSQVSPLGEFRKSARKEQVMERAIAAAQAGDFEARKALAERGISWQL